MKKLIPVALILLFSATGSGNTQQPFQDGKSTIGTFDNPAVSAAQILVLNPTAADGFYWLDPDGSGGDEPFQAFCDMTTEGGGWTLVLLSNASVSQCPSPTWEEVINNVNYNGEYPADLASFDLFLGVKYWNALGTELRLDMGAGPSSLSHRTTYNFSLDEVSNYALSMTDETVLIHTEGTASPGMYTYHNGRQLSTCNADHDASGGNCATFYNCAAWWYGNCWSGSFWGGGGESFLDAPYWTGTTTESFAYGSIWIRGSWTPELPTVTTLAVSDATYTTALGNGNITDLGSPNPTAYGVCWNTTGTPDIADSSTDEGYVSSTGTFTSSITGLLPNTTYYVKAYATNFAGTAYGNEVSFTTPEDITPPNVMCKDTIIYLDENGEVTIDTTFINDGTEDDFCLDTIYLGIDAFTCSNIGDNIVTLYAKDLSGNIDSCSATVTVLDTIAPDISCLTDQVVDAGASNTYTVTGSEFDPVFEDDNCNYTVLNDLTNSDILTGTELPAGNTTLKWIITDESGNKDSCSFEITVNAYTGVSPVDGINVSVYPNPFKERVTVEFFTTKHSTRIDVMNVIGSQIYSAEIKESKNPVDLSMYPSGFYYLKISDNDRIFVIKLIKQ